MYTWASREERDCEDEKKADGREKRGAVTDGKDSRELKAEEEEEYAVFQIGPLSWMSFITCRRCSPLRTA